MLVHRRYFQGWKI